MKLPRRSRQIIFKRVSHNFQRRVKNRITILLPSIFAIYSTVLAEPFLRFRTRTGFFSKCRRPIAAVRSPKNVVNSMRVLATGFSVTSFVKDIQEFQRDHI